MPRERSSSAARRAWSAVKDTFSRTSTGAVRWFRPTRTISIPLLAHSLEVPVTVRKIEIYDREAEHDDHEIKNAQTRGPSAAPCCGARELKIGGVEQEHQKCDYILRIVIPVLTGQAVHPDEAEDRAYGDRNQADQDAGTAHALEEFEGRQPPDDFAELAASQQAILDQKDQAEHERECKGGIREDT